jgi:hypothetical protein
MSAARIGGRTLRGPEELLLDAGELVEEPIEQVERGRDPLRFPEMGLGERGGDGGQGGQGEDREGTAKRHGARLLSDGRVSPAIRAASGPSSKGVRTRGLARAPEPGGAAPLAFSIRSCSLSRAGFPPDVSATRRLTSRLPFQSVSRSIEQIISLGI